MHWNDHWNYSSDSDPVRILMEAVDDARDGFYQRALDKHIWFHLNAATLNDELSCIRLTFALSNWIALAECYRPAHDALEHIRDEKRVKLFDASSIDGLFTEIAIINDRMGEGHLTSELFIKLSNKDFLRARNVYSEAEEYLVKSGHYELCNSFLEPEARLGAASRVFRDLIGLDVGQNQLSEIGLAESLFGFQVGKIVAVLALSGRVVEASEIRRRALETDCSLTTRSYLDRAASGLYPKYRRP